MIFGEWSELKNFFDLTPHLLKRGVKSTMIEYCTLKAPASFVFNTIYSRILIPQQISKLALILKDYLILLYLTETYNLLGNFLLGGIAKMNRSIL